MGWERKWIWAISCTHIRAMFQKHATFHKKNLFIQLIDLTKEWFIFSSYFCFHLSQDSMNLLTKKWGTINFEFIILKIFSRCGVDACYVLSKVSWICKMLQIWKLFIHMHVSVCMVCTMQGGMKKQWDEYYALYIVTWIQSGSMLHVKWM